MISLLQSKNNICLLVFLCTTIIRNTAQGQHIDIITNSIERNGAGSNNKEVDLSGLGEENNEFYDMDTITVQLANNNAPDIQSFKRMIGSKSRDIPIHAETENKQYSLDFARVEGENDDGLKAVSGVIDNLDGNEIYKYYTDANGVDRVSIHSVDDFPIHDEPMVQHHGRNRNLRAGNEPKNNNHFAPKAAEPETNNITKSSDHRRSLPQKAEIDVMIIWTQKAECHNSGLRYPCVFTRQTLLNMDALVKAAIATTNAAFELSGVNAHLNLAVAYRHPTYTEYNDDSSATRNALFDLSGGRVEDMSVMREKYGADMVHLIVAETNGSCGTGYMGPGINLALSSSDVECTVTTHSFAHEIGHNLDARHDRGTSGACDDNARTNYGYRGNRYRTIMSYPCGANACDNGIGNQGRCRRLNRFSHPGSFNGESIGDEQNDNVSRMNAVVNEVEKYYRKPSIIPPRPIMHYEEHGPIAPPGVETAADNCFSPDTTVTVIGQDRDDVKIITMKDLQVGDKVLTASGEYQSVYTFDHFHRSKMTTFTRITTQLTIHDHDEHRHQQQQQQYLEVTPNHLIFVEGKSYPIPASQIRINDVLQSIRGPINKVINVELVTRNGFYNPLTPDGTIIVADGIITSTYTSYDSKNSHIEIAGFKIIPIHHMVNIAAAIPYRTFCTISSSISYSEIFSNYYPSHNTTDDGYTKASQTMRQLYMLWLNQNNGFKCISILLYLLFFTLIGLILKFKCIISIIATIFIISTRTMTNRRNISALTTMANKGVNMSSF